MKRKVTVADDGLVLREIRALARRQGSADTAREDPRPFRCDGVPDAAPRGLPRTVDATAKSSSASCRTTRAPRRATR